MSHRTIFPAFSAALLVILCQPCQVGAQSSSPDEILSESVSSTLLAQLAEGLRGHSVRTFLAAFDLSRMDGGPVFKEQITAFFNQYESIRIHFKLVEIKEDTAIVDTELDATPAGAANPPLHKNRQLRLTATKVPAGWRFIDVQPRDFFS